MKMFKSLIIDLEKVKQNLTERNYDELTMYLNYSFKLDRDENGAFVLFAFSVDIINSLKEILSAINTTKIDEGHTEILKELFKSWRNYVVTPEVQTYISADNNFLNLVELTLTQCARAASNVVPLILQFLINLVVRNKFGASKVNSIFSTQLYNLLRDRVCIHETAALLYNISLFQNLSLNHENYVCIFEVFASDNQSEFLNFLLEVIITYEDFWYHYNLLQSNHRLIVLSVIRDKQIKGETLNFPEKGLDVLSTCFINSGSVIFQTVSTNDANSEPYEVSELLQVISSLCSSEKYLPYLQKNKDLLINTGVLLINIHQLGKDTENCFSSIQRLAEIRQPPEEISGHPAFGFKADLIRIIGNLCWKSETMQDLTREAELIPVILDCCNMDARNPFIMQWVIFAVRNLCEKNLENQKIVAGLHQQGTVGSSVLDEMGLTLQSSGENSIKVVPLDALRDKK